MCSLLLLPYVNIFLLENYEQQYQSATLEIFQSLNPDTRRVINPKLQMDQIINASPEITQAVSTIDLGALNYLDEIDLSNIRRSTINFSESILELDIDGLPALKYTFVLKLIDGFDVTIVEDRTNNLDGKISGTLVLDFSHD
jgi:type II secretory pathway component PulL